MDIMISICCTTYNHENYIRSALDSFLDQDFKLPYEILIHDDASSDSTPLIIKEYQQKYPDIIKPILQTENKYSQNIPINESYNFPRAMGKYIALCEGDDFWIDNTKLSRQFEYMQANPNCTFCFTNGIIKDMSAQKADRNFIPYYQSEAECYKACDYSYTLDDMLLLSFIPTASFMFPTQALLNLPSSFHDKMCPYGDLRMKLFLSASGYARYIHMFSCIYRENVSNSAMHIWSKEKRNIAFLRYKSTVEMFKDLNSFTNNEFAQQISKAMDTYVFAMLMYASDYSFLDIPECKARYKKLNIVEKLKLYAKMLFTQLKLK